MHVGLYPIWPWTGLCGPKPSLIGIYSFTKGLVLLQPLPSQLSGERAMQTLGDLLTGFRVKLRTAKSPAMTCCGMLTRLPEGLFLLLLFLEVKGLPSKAR